MKSESEKIAGSIILKEYGLFFKQQFQDFFEFCDNQQTWENNRTFLPIQIILEPKEVIPMINLVSSDNTVITKVLAVFSSLCVEVIHLKKEAIERHIPFISIYDEYKESSITNQIKSICHLNAFIARCEDTLKNLFGQLFGLYAESYINLDGVELHYIINHIGELMTILILIELLISKTSLPKNWNIYYKNITNVNHKSDYAELSDEKINFLHGTIENITEKIMSDTIVQNNLNNLLAVKSKKFEKGHTLIVAEFTRYLRLLITNLDKLIQENPQSTNMYKSVKANALFVLTSYVFGINDKKIFRILIDLNVKAHSIHIAGKVLWFPEQFLLRHVPGLCESYGKMQQVILKARQNFIINRKTSIVRDEFNLLNAVSQWNLKVEQFFDVTHVQLNASEINIHAKILISGLEIASHANYILLTLVNLHVSLGIPLSKNMLVSIFQMLESIKILKSTILRNHHAIINSINMVVQHYMYQIISCTANIKQNLMLDKNYANQKLDELTCLVVAERALRGAPTPERITSAALALALLPAIACPEDSRANLGFLFEKINTLSNYLMTMHQLCDSSWIFWHQTVLPLYLSKTVLTDSTDAFRLQHTYTVLEDCAMLLHNSDKHFGITKIVAYQNNIEKLIDNLIMKSSCQQIETDLRLHIHSHLKLDVSNPFVNDILKKSFLFIDNFRLLQTYICVVPTVEHYLSTMYYNLTTVVLSNWKTYGEMRQMAAFKLNLRTVEDNLPTQTLEQGLDVLEIMRNIHVFVSKYLYNLNNQIFIEKSSNNKHLNSINIRHIANSIRTHGTGIMNTTVNFTYQFLKNKFQTFSQFMYDEQIKSRLNKDLKIFKDNFDTNGKMYCYKNAERFNRGIRNLGLDEDGQSYLDLFRDLISQIGNAMGYVRMIRSGGRHSCADAIVFLPSLNIDKTFTSLTDECSLHANTKEAAINLDACIENLTTNFTKGTEYFSLLVDVFAPVFRNPKNIHLKNFYIIVPPLTLNFVEHLILSKDRMSKKNKVGAAFTDDGFAMGVAYILKLLDQDSNFESLHWFDSVEKYIKEARESLEEQKSKGSLQLHQTLALTEKKITTLEQEFKLLQYSLSSARIFFR